MFRPQIKATVLCPAAAAAVSRAALSLAGAAFLTDKDLRWKSEELAPVRCLRARPPWFEHDCASGLVLHRTRRIHLRFTILKIITHNIMSDLRLRSIYRKNERHDRETEIRSAMFMNTKIKSELAEMDVKCNDLIDQRGRLQVLVSEMDDCRSQHGQSLLQTHALQEEVHTCKINMDKLQGE
ncbi:hypothetical protein EVAR_7470_1 [Eumeta japonica]|uniref:Uncharacterized protein n=1 Tax=Eumeta variegata TaxID=151549 RepID=A0A4C2A2H3_EUMVA|nr:hypothetical protein EVAR_7470_1 [Eumeta japonica]